MKSLQTFINERVEIFEAEGSKTITFDFTDLEIGEERLKSLYEKVDTVQDILQQFAETIRNSTKRSSDEQYAQKTKAFAEKVAEFNDALDEIANPNEEE